MRPVNSKYTLAYFAGFFDGEGCICIASQGSKTRNGVIRKRYRLEVAVGSTNHWIIEMMKFQFGGAVYTDRRDNHPKTHRPFWRWMICSNQAKVFLEEVLPFLTIKKAEADIAIKWQANRIRGQLPKEDREKANALAEAKRIMLSALKRKE